MRASAIPSKATIRVLAVSATIALVLLVVGVPLPWVGWAVAAFSLVAFPTAVADLLISRRDWRQGNATLTRHLPAAFAIGVKKPIALSIDIESTHTWKCTLHDHVEPNFAVEGLPLTCSLTGGKRTEVSYVVTPSERGLASFEPASLRIQSRLNIWELLERLGADEQRRVYPDFAQVGRYAWLAGDHRLAEIGIKTYRQRGQGTDFKQLSEYRSGHSVRHIDWKATLRLDKPIIREFQDERDQNALLLIDCGRRMRADDSQQSVGSSHFDQVLNATMLLTYVALKQGDAVGAMTFGTPPGEERWFAPRKGLATLNALMGELYDVQPTPTHPDYLAAATALLRRQHKRSLVIVITNFRDEDSTELKQALKLLRSRHLVLLASLRERVVRELMSQSIDSGEAAVDIASAHLFEQSRRDAFNRLAARDALMIDAEPDRLGVELVNRYNAVKRAHLL